MMLKPGELAYGVDPHQLIACAKAVHLAHVGWFTFNDFARALGGTRPQAKKLFEQLQTDGFFHSEGLKAGQYAGTKKLAQLGAAHVTDGIPRKTADLLLQRVIVKAEQVNADWEQYPYAISKLVVFGSYLGTAPLLGDLDLGLELCAQVRPKGRKSDYRGMYWHGRVASALRLRKPDVIVICLLADVVELGTAYKEVFKFSPEE